MRVIGANVSEPPALWDDIDDLDDEVETVVARYLPEAVVWTTDWTTGSLADQLSRELFDVEPPFQRRAVWSPKKSSTYIESLLLGCPVPAITLAEAPSDHDFHYIVIDGKQRLSALKMFAVDQSLILSGLEVLDELNGLDINQLRAHREFGRFENLPIRTNVVRNWSKDEVLHFIFNRLNTQVTTLSTHELRRSLIPGPFMSYLDQRSAESQAMLDLLKNDQPDSRLRDAELLLRAIAFTLYQERYRGNLKRFLDEISRALNRQWSSGDTRKRIENSVRQIEDAIAATFEVFGSEAFQRYDDDGNPVGRMNRAVFDAMVVALSDPHLRQSALRQPAEARTAFASLFGDEEYARWTTSTTKTVGAVEGRINRWRDRLTRLGDDVK